MQLDLLKTNKFMCPKIIIKNYDFLELVILIKYLFMALNACSKIEINLY